MDTNFALHLKWERKLPQFSAKIKKNEKLAYSNGIVDTT